MRSSVKVQHLAVFILLCIAKLPSYVSAVIEKDGEGQVKSQVNDRDKDILDYIVRFEDTKSYQSFLQTEVQVMDSVTSLPFMNAEVLKFSSAKAAKDWSLRRKDIRFVMKGMF